MNDNTKLYVFSKREIALIFLFMFLIALTSFVFGVKVGKDYSYKASGLAPEDRQKIDLMSEQEESVNEILKDESEHTKVEDQKLIDDLNKKLEEHIRIKTDDSENIEMKPDEDRKPNQGNVMEEPAPGVTVPAMGDSSAASNDVQDDMVVEENKYSGKYTINLGAYQSVEEARDFAEGFKVRGYNPIINEVNIPGKGVWYRVSLGVFDHVSEAKEYVKKEYSLFQGQDHFFTRFD